MDWKELGQKVIGAAPLLGTALGGPAGAAIGALIASTLGTGNTPNDVSQALITDPDAAVKIKQLEVEQTVKLQELVMQNALNVNTTMQAEATAEHWPTYSWRPAIGFAVAINITGSVLIVLIAYAGVMFAGVKPDLLSYLPSMLAAMAALVGVASPILGIASWFRGKMQADPAILVPNKL